MFFWFKRNKVVIDCYIDNQIMCDTYQIKKGIKVTPSWWKDLAPVVVKYREGSKFLYPTVKKCPGFVDLYLKSWVIPMWSDLTICTDKSGGFRYAFPHAIKYSDVTAHPDFQYEGGFPAHGHLKLVCPWLVIDTHKSNTKFMFTPTSWSLFNDLPDLRVLPGITDYTYNSGVHINCLIPKVDAEYFIKAGTPMVHLTPLTDKEVEFKSHTVTSNEYERLLRNHNPRSYNKFTR